MNEKPYFFCRVTTLTDEISNVKKELLQKAEDHMKEESLRARLEVELKDVRNALLTTRAYYFSCDNLLLSYLSTSNPHIKRICTLIAATPLK